MWKRLARLVLHKFGKFVRIPGRGLDEEGGALNLFSGRDVRPGFPKCEACKIMLATERGVL